MLGPCLRMRKKIEYPPPPPWGLHDEAILFEDGDIALYKYYLVARNPNSYMYGTEQTAGTCISSFIIRNRKVKRINLLHAKL